ncbi:cytochrome c oxidase subunit I [Planctomycetota bacterium]|nr:cytochrome c oxidase subunit I [Planctomycetota bacterium]
MSGPQENYLNCSSGFASWAFTLDHKRIGVMYLVATLGSFFVAGMLALLVRTELMFEGPQLLNQNQYNQAFTLHGAIMVFLFIIPAVPGALGNFVLPIMLGAKDVAFPRLNLGSFYLWIIGAVCAVSAILLGGVDTGWTFYTPYSTQDGRFGVEMMAMGVFILGFSSIFTGLNFIVTIHKLRPAGMTWFRMPLFLWGIYATAICQVLATPVIGITVVLLMVERTMQVGIFNPDLGGDPVLFQHFFWFYSHPAVYIMILPGLAIISELIPTFSRKSIFGYKFIAFSSVAIAAFGFLVWGHHMFTSGQSNLMSMIFSALTFSVSIPTAVKIFNWLATMYKGSISFKTPMLYALGFLFTFTIGGLTGIFLGTLSVDVHLHDTYFVVAHFHYVMMGGTVIAMLGGLHYWWPKITGKMYSETPAKLGFWLVFIGFNVTFLVQFGMGSLGMPRRYFDYPGDIYGTYHLWSTIGSYILAVGFFVHLGTFIHSLLKGVQAPRNPWGGATLEWQANSPPSHYNFDSTPTATEPYDYDNLIYDEQIGGWVNKAPVAEGTA